MNNVILKGRLVADPELRQTQSNISVVSFKIAVDKYVKDGEKQADFIECSAWRATAEFISKYFRKGQEILISRGALHNKNWTDKDGVKHYTYEVTAEAVEFCGSKASNSNAGNDASVEIGDLGSFEEILSNGDVPF